MIRTKVMLAVLIGALFAFGVSFYQRAWHRDTVAPVVAALRARLGEEAAPPPSSAADGALLRLAPYLVFIGVSATFVVMPFGHQLVGADLDIGVLFLITLTALVSIALVTGGWSASGRWSLLGALRAAAQIIAYEIPAATAVVCVVMMTGSLRLQDIIGAQGGTGNHVLDVGGWPWYWYVFRNPITFGLFFLYFTTALADQPDDDHVGRGVAGHHADQHRFTHARAGEQAHPLAAADGEQAVDGADADVQRLGDRRPL